MSIPEKASMAPKRNIDNDVREIRLERAVLALEALVKELKYINNNIFETAKAVNNVERAIDRFTIVPR